MLAIFRPTNERGSCYQDDNGCWWFADYANRSWRVTRRQLCIIGGHHA